MGAPPVDASARRPAPPGDAERALDIMCFHTYNDDMNSRLQDELRQTRPFGSVVEEAALSVARTAAVIDHATAELFRQFGVTGTQYNVLRILRGAGDGGLCRFEIGERLVAQVPDVTRLLDRMEDAGLVVRARSDEDRRLVRTRITAEGLAVLDRIAEPLAELQRRRFRRLDAEQLRSLVDLLALVRQGD